MTTPKNEENLEFYDKWDTSPVVVNVPYVGDDYTAEEWRCRRQVENEGSDMHTYSPWVCDLSELEIGL